MEVEIGSAGDSKKQEIFSVSSCKYTSPISSPAAVKEQETVTQTESIEQSVQLFADEKPAQTHRWRGNAPRDGSSHWDSLARFLLALHNMHWERKQHHKKHRNHQAMKAHNNDMWVADSIDEAVVEGAHAHTHTHTHTYDRNGVVEQSHRTCSWW